MDILLASHDAVVLACGAAAWRDLPVPGRELDGIHQAMEYLPPSNRVQEGDLEESPITATGKHVVIIGGGDTGADCLGTAHRQGAASIHQFEILPRPPDSRADSNPWPTYPNIYRVSSAHEEGGERVYSVNTERFVDDDDGQRARCVCTRSSYDRRQVPEGRGHRLRAALPSSCCWRWASSGPRRALARPSSASSSTARGNVARDAEFMTNVPGVFVADGSHTVVAGELLFIPETRTCWRS